MGRYLILFLFCYISGSAQEDSLLYYYNSGQTLSGDQLILYTRQLKKIDSIKIFRLGQKILSDENRSDFFYQIGRNYYEDDNYSAAEIYFFKALEIDKIKKNKSKIARNLSSLGDIYRLQAKTTLAFDFLFQAITMSKEIKNNELTIYNLALIGDVYRVTNQLRDALKYLNEALAINIGDTLSRSKAFSYSCLGSVYASEKKYNKAQDSYESGLAIAQSMNDTLRIIDFEGSLGYLHIEQKSYEKARVFFERAMELSKIRNDQYNLSVSYLGLAEINYKQKQYKQAITNGLLGYEIGRSITSPGIYSDAAELLYQAYYAFGDYKNAFDYFKIKQEADQSTIDLIQVKEQAQLEFNFLKAYKEKHDSMQRAEKEEQRELVQKAEIKQQKALGIAGLASAFIAIVIIIVVFRFYQKEKAARQIIDLQKNIVEAKNKEILDSINYAKKIQEAIIPSSVEMHNLFPDHFVLLLPRDIVSGDFYWVGSKLNYTFFAVADCTGHGVPGGFMSMLGTALLNEIINEKEVYEPADILDLLKLKIIMALRQSENVGEMKDGMDIALCRIDKSNKELAFAGANNSMHLIRNNELIELKGDKQPIGISHFNSTQQFKQQAVILEKGDVVYLFTDGYPDQFGGDRGKKYKYKQLESLLMSIHLERMNEQVSALQKELESWKGDLEQVDDICVLGIKI